MRSSVPAVWAQLPQPGGDDGRAQPPCRPRYDLALGAARRAELNRRCRRELRPTNGSWRVDETYLRVAGKWTYLYRGVDSTGATIDFLLSARRNASAAKRFLQKALRSPGHPRPRVIKMDGNPPYPKVIGELKKTGELGRRCRCRPVRYLKNIVKQDHRAIKRRVRASQRFRFPLSDTNDSRHRDDQHDPERTGEVVGKGRHRGAGRFRRSITRTRRCCLTPSDEPTTILAFERSQHFHPADLVPYSRTLPPMGYPLPHVGREQTR